VANTPEGVMLEVEGEDAALALFRQRLASEHPHVAHIRIADRDADSANRR
jgi:hydrogenase maturation factor HypF (carbamoyltransferase family)